jgi:hypothetical protein
MKQREVIEFLREDHKILWDVVGSLTEAQIEGEAVLGEWNVRDIVAHVTAWHWKLIEAAERLLKNKEPWVFADGEDEFNREKVEARRGVPIERIMVEWHDSYYALIRRIESLSEEEWSHSLADTWEDGSPISVQSLFGYRYRGEGHEGGHALQIKEYFSI